VTKPLSPKLKTKDRLELKVKFDTLIGNGPTEKKPFKAKVLNKKILNGVDKLPAVEKKERTEFKEFILSGKRPIYTGDKENLIERAEAAM